MNENLSGLSAREVEERRRYGRRKDYEDEAADCAGESLYAV